MRTFLALLLLCALVSTVLAAEAPTPFQRLASSVDLVATPKATSFTCTNALYDCSNNGYCNREGTGCICERGYATHECDPTVQCCYAKESRVKLFIIAFFTSWTGAPYFIVGAVGMGVGILLLCCGGIVLAGIGCGTGAYKENLCLGIIGGLGILCVIAAIAWHLGTWIALAAGTEPYNDKNDVPIGPWP